jgi:GDPmannose 4,6-dehydratase
MNGTQLITGVSGQDGAYLAAHLLAQGAPVVGTRRPGGGDAALWRLHELGIAAHPKLRLVGLDIGDVESCRALLASLQPEALFHLAAQSRVADSLRDPQASVAANGAGAVNLLEAVRTASPQTRFVLASSAELFGDAAHSPQSEATPFAPRNPYAMGKHVAHEATQAYRAQHGLHASCAILFNHESPLRDAAFVTRKITAGAVRLAQHGGGAPLALGNLAAQRDFGYAPEYVVAMARMAVQTQPDDYVLATGVATSIRTFAELAFAAAGVALRWQGSGAGEHAVDAHGRVLVTVDAALFRAVDAAVLVGDAAKARAQLGFAPRTTVAELARLMVVAETRR